AALALLLPALPAARAEKQPPDPLETLNDSFRKSYRETRAEALASARPVILVEGDTLVLLRKSGRSEAADYIPPVYTPLKAPSRLHPAQVRLDHPPGRVRHAVAGDDRRLDRGGGGRPAALPRAGGGGPGQPGEARLPQAGPGAPVPDRGRLAGLPRRRGRAEG